MNAPLRIEVPLEHPVFAGHFPGAPVWPGALLLDEVARHLPRTHGGALAFEAVKFRRPVGPGAVLTLAFTARADGGWAFELRDAQDRPVAGGRVHEGVTT